MILGNTSSQGKYIDPPTSVSASAGNAQATVSFTLPVYDGKGTATYVATASPGGTTASGASSPLVVTGLSNDTSYTFTVSTISGYGVSATSAASTAVTPIAPPPSFPPSFGPSFPPSFGPSFPVCCPSGGSYGGDGYCYIPSGCGGCSVGSDTQYSDCGTQGSRYCCGGGGDLIQCYYPAGC